MSADLEDTADEGVEPDEDMRAGILLMAHDLGSPLTAIRVLAELLREDASTVESRDDARDVLEAADLASMMVEGLSSLARTGDQRELTWFPLDLRTILEKAVDRPAMRRRIQLDLQGAMNLAGDRRALQRAFTQVFLNGIRMTDSGQQLKCTVRRGDPGLLISIVHPGVTVSADTLTALFRRGGAAELRRLRIPVSAIGLAHAKEILLSHGASMQFQQADDGVVLQIVMKA